jgi:hypothetical protein
VRARVATAFAPVRAVVAPAARAGGGDCMSLKNERERERTSE